MPVVRLMRADAASWPLYPKMEARVRAFVEKYDLTCPIDAVLQEMGQRWFATPELAGYFLSIDGGFINGHLISWIGANYGVNRLYIYQAEMTGTKGPLRETWSAVQDWLASLNEKTAEAFQVKRAEWATWIEPGVWKRYMGQVGINVEKVRHVLECDIK